MATCLYRIAQESLTNVLRHARADKALVTLRRKGGWCQLQIRDNGVGITEARANGADAFGLMGMRERVAFSRGRFAVESAPQKGTVIRVTWPLDISD